MGAEFFNEVRRLTEADLSFEEEGNMSLLLDFIIGTVRLCTVLESRAQLTQRPRDQETRRPGGLEAKSFIVVIAKTAG